MSELLAQVASRIGSSINGAALMRALMAIFVLTLLVISVSMALRGHGEPLASGIAWGR